MGDSVLCDGGLAGRGVCGDEYTFVSLDGVDSDLLEWVESEGVNTCWLCGRDMLRDGCVVVPRWHGDLVPDLRTRGRSNTYKAFEGISANLVAEFKALVCVCT